MGTWLCDSLLCSTAPDQPHKGADTMHNCRLAHTGKVLQQSLCCALPVTAPQAADLPVMISITIPFTTKCALTKQIIHHISLDINHQYFAHTHCRKNHLSTCTGITATNSLEGLIKSWKLGNQIHSS